MCQSADRTTCEMPVLVARPVKWRINCN